MTKLISAILTAIILTAGLFVTGLGIPDVFGSGQGKGGDADKGKEGHGEKGCEIAKAASGGKTKNPHCATPPPPTGCASATTDLCIDLDGIASAGPGTTADEQVTNGTLLASFPVTNGTLNSGLDMFDNDANGQWTMGAAGDDLHSEGNGTCATAIRDAVHQLGQDCKVLDIDASLFTGQSVDCDLEFGIAFTACPPFAGANAVRYHDANGNGGWDSGEDIVLDVNGDGIFN
jgi:hypothetical protein